MWKESSQHLCQYFFFLQYLPFSVSFMLGILDCFSSILPWVKPGHCWCWVSILTVSEWVDNFRWRSHWVLQPVRLFLGFICLPHCPAALLALVPVLEYQACFSPFPCSGHLHDSIIPAPSLYSPYSVLDCLGLLHASDTASLVLSFRKFSNRQCLWVFVCV